MCKWLTDAYREFNVALVAAKAIRGSALHTKLSPTAATSTRTFDNPSSGIPNCGSELACMNWMRQDTEVHAKGNKMGMWKYASSAEFVGEFRVG